MDVPSPSCALRAGTCCHMQMNDTGNDNVCLDCHQGTQSPGVDQTNVYNQLLMYNVRVPPGWTFPKCNVHSAHKLWHIQNTVNGQCAMRFLRPADIDHYKDGQRRLEEFRFLMWRFDECARQLGLLRHTMTELDCNIAINATIEMLGVPLETPTGRRRHLERLKWPMYLSLMPAKQRPSIEDLAVTYQGKRRL